MQKTSIKRGDIRIAQLNPVIGSEQGSCRPVLVVQNNTGNSYSPTVVIVPITGNLLKNSLPTHVVIPQSSGLENDSIALVEQIRTIDRSRFIDYIGHIDYETQFSVDKALAVCVGLEKRRHELSVRSLCRYCEADYRNNGYKVTKRGWQEFKTNCDICHRPGWLFSIF